MTAPVSITIPAVLETRIAKARQAIRDAQATEYGADPVAWWNRNARAYHGLADVYDAAAEHTEPETLLRYAVIAASSHHREQALDAERHADRAKSPGGAS